MKELLNKVGEQNLYNQFGHFKFILLLSVALTTLGAKTFENFQRSHASSSIVYKYQDDAVFEKYLKSNWEAYIFEKPLVRYKGIKPSKIYPSRKIDFKKQGPKVNIYIKDGLQSSLDTNATAIENILHDDGHISTKDVEFNFFGTKVEFNIPEGILKAKFYPQNQHGIKNFFDLASISEYELLLKDIKSISKKLQLNDWGIYLLIGNISQRIFPSQDDSKLFSWFLFNKLGYSVRIGLVKKHVVLMHQSEKPIYAIPYCVIDENNFYVLEDNRNVSKDKVFTYKQDYPNADKILDLSMKTLPNFVRDEKEITIPFKIEGNKYSIVNRFNQNLIDFMATYPQADYETYFNTPIDEVTYEQIARKLKKYIDTKHASVAIDFILKFVQKAFKYEVDQKQFGKEKVMFVQETLYYEKSDCEDRAILFSYLVNKLLHISSVGVKYSDHMATALYIPMKGDNVRVNGKKYIIADPTYINATIGQSMPKYRGIKPQRFIHVNKQ